MLGMVLAIGMVFAPSTAAGNTIRATGGVDLTVEVIAKPATAGSVIQYESVIRNRGTEVAELVLGTFEVPAVGVTMDFETESCNVVGSMRLEQDGTGQQQPWTVSCELGTLAPGAETRVAFSIILGSNGTGISVATASSNGSDVRPFNNRVEVPIYVLPDAPGFTPAFQQPGQSNPMSRSTA